jgi:Holliday junction resolvase RusA-like endonuclease
MVLNSFSACSEIGANIRARADGNPEQKAHMINQNLTHVRKAIPRPSFTRTVNIIHFRKASARRRTTKVEPETETPPASIGHNSPPGIEIDLPLPTSTNRIWRRGHARSTGRTWTYLSKSYVTWKGKAADALKEQFPQLPAKIDGPFDVQLVITKAKRYKLDLDNRIKACLDFCAQSGLIADDKFQNRVVVEWGKAPMGARLTLTPAEPDS